MCFFQPVHPGHMEAILKYEGAPAQDPSSAARTCTPQAPCEVLNCPYRSANALTLKVLNIQKKTWGPISNVLVTSF